MAKLASRISKLIRKHYGIRLRDILASNRHQISLGKYEHVDCNLCNSGRFHVVGEKDKYGISIKTVICENCGLLQLNPRPTAEAYSEHYSGGGQLDGTYHLRIQTDADLDHILKKYFGKNFVKLHTEQEFLEVVQRAEGAEIDSKASDVGESHEPYNRYAEHLAHYLSDVLRAEMRVFDVGASKGQLLYTWRNLVGCEVAGVEPKRESVEQAIKRYNVDLYEGFSDNPNIPKSYYDFVTNIRTINHMLDPLAELRLAHSFLKDDGLIFIDIQDSVEQAVFGFESSVVEIDHPYMFSLNTLKAMVQVAGFEVVKSERFDLRAIGNIYTQTAYPRQQIRILARKCNHTPEVDWSNPFSELANLYRVSNLAAVDSSKKLEQRIQKKDADISIIRERSIRKIEAKDADISRLRERSIRKIEAKDADISRIRERSIRKIEAKDATLAQLREELKIAENKYKDAMRAMKKKAKMGDPIA